MISRLRRNIIPTIAGLMTLPIIFIVLTQFASADSHQSQNWKEDWAVEEGFGITVDVEGFQIPTAIAFIPEPGNDPKDPLYFVTELQGAVKVVTNDRSVFTFADDFFNLEPKDHYPVIGQEIGMAGICLAPDNGYVFVTFTYHDSSGILRNNMVRFQSTPDVFSLEPSDQKDFTKIFSGYQSIPSHQISACQVQGNNVFVNVGDAGQVTKSQQVDSLLGKVLKMTLNGEPSTGNPYHQTNDIQNARNYVWAYGLRNPFGLKLVNGQVFVADNGPTVDRFLQVHKGENYLWDGSNISIGTNSDVLFSPGRGVAQMDYHPRESQMFPGRFRNSFFLTMTSNPEIHRSGWPAIWQFKYDMDLNRVISPPRVLMRYRGKEAQVVSSLAFGSDGLYFAPLKPRPGESSSKIFKIQHSPRSGHPFTLQNDQDANSLMHTLGCISCHAWPDNPGGDIGPNLGKTELTSRLIARLNSKEYANAMHLLDSAEGEPFSSSKEARQSVMKATGHERIRLWIFNRLLEPRFDDPTATMPQLGLTDHQANLIATFLSEAPVDDNGFANQVSGFGNAIKGIFPKPTRSNAREFAIAILLIGMLAGSIGTMFIWWVIIKRKTGVE